MKIYTKTGDHGQTSLIDNQRIDKDDFRIEAYGTADELNAHIALLACIVPDNYCQKTLQDIEKKLFVIQTQLAINDIANCKQEFPHLTNENVTELEAAIDNLQAQLQPNRAFVLLDAHQIVAQCHIARTICRRLERRIVSLHKIKPIDSLILKYINRLSDFLFVLARYVTVLVDAKETEITL
ncbi:MAG: cob(I)yrinic acid a,c-diamide adenosyltransferase [Bacteroidales bacterium]|nr:cob(I)yrinic acid a,c-diamide adenosyltransferase [Bacteroidales bacterium]